MECWVERRHLQEGGFETFFDIPSLVESSLGGQGAGVHGRGNYVWPL